MLLRRSKLMPIVVLLLGFTACKKDAGDGVSRDAGVAVVAQRPNIVLLISNDQDYEHFGFMGHPAAPTPRIDALAESGVLFKHAHLPMSRCHPVLGSLLSGRWPHQSGMYFNYGKRKLDPENSLPLLLREAGYATMVSGIYWEGYPERLGFSHGDMNPTDVLVRKHQKDVFKFLEETAGKKPFFMWWAPKLPHRPHTPKGRHKKLVDRSKIEIPDYYKGDPKVFKDKEFLSHAMEAWLDEGFGELVDKMKEVGAHDNTIYVFFVDNGYANGIVSKGTAFEKGLRTPLIFSYPGHIPAGRVVDRMVSTHDIYATVLDYAGLKIPTTAAGRSLKPFFEDAATIEPTTMYGAIYPAFASEEERPELDLYALYAHDERWKYVLYFKNLREKYNRPKYRIFHSLAKFPTRDRGDVDLFDLRNDPYELNNLSGDPEHAERMKQYKRGALSWWSGTGGKRLDVP